MGRGAGRSGKRPPSAPAVARAAAASSSSDNEEEASLQHVAATPTRGRKPRSLPSTPVGAQPSSAQLVGEQQRGPHRCAGCDVSAKTDGSNWGRVAVNNRDKPCPDFGYSICGRCDDYVASMGFTVEEFLGSLLTAKGKAKVLANVEAFREGKLKPNVVNFEREQVFEDIVQTSSLEDRFAP
jgi:hypothetical protein